MHSTDNLEDGYFGSGKRLWYSINKYGKENHTMEILEFCESREQLKIREKEVIGNLWKLDEDCLNLRAGGEGGGGFFTKEQQIKCSLAGTEGLKKKLEDPSFKEAVRKKVSEGLKQFYANGGTISNPWDSECRERAQSLEARSKRKATMKERGHGVKEKNSQFGKQWIYNNSLKICKRINKEDPIPEGWSKGRKMRFNDNTIDC